MQDRKKMTDKLKDKCCVCLSAFKRKTNGFMRYSVNARLCQLKSNVFKVADAIEYLLPRAVQFELRPFMCASCYGLIKGRNSN